MEVKQLTKTEIIDIIGAIKKETNPELLQFYSNRLKNQCDCYIKINETFIPFNHLFEYAPRKKEYYITHIISRVYLSMIQIYFLKKDLII